MKNNHDGNTMPRVKCRSLKKLKNMAARLRERVAFGNCNDSRWKARQRLQYVQQAIAKRIGGNNG